MALKNAWCGNTNEPEGCMALKNLWRVQNTPRLRGDVIGKLCRFSEKAHNGAKLGSRPLLGHPHQSTRMHMDYYSQPKIVSSDLKRFTLEILGRYVSNKDAVQMYRSFEIVIA